MNKLTFKDYLQEEVVTSRRQGIVHLQAMKPIDFFQFAKNLLKETEGKLKNIPITLKVDGFSARFGKNQEGTFFIETGRAPPIYQSKAFSTFTRNKGGDDIMIERAEHYDDIYEHLKECTLWKILPKDTKVICELLYNPMAIEEKNQLKFVSIKYDKTKLGSLMTIVPIAIIIASSGEKHPREKAIISLLLEHSDSKIKVISPKLKNITLDINAELNPLNFLEEDDEKIIATLKSLKHNDKEKKLEYTNILQSIKNELAEKIMKHPIKDSDMLGKDIEGYIFEIDNRMYKITTPDFKAQKKAEKTK